MSSYSVKTFLCLLLTTSITFSSPQLIVKEYLIQRLTILKLAEKYFKNVPGYQDLSQKIVTTYDSTPSKGYWFELETALTIIKQKTLPLKLKEKITAFHHWIRIPKIGYREIDIVTNKRCIECKNIKWNNLSQEQIDSIIKKLQDQQQLVLYCNSNNIPICGNTNLEYILWSKNQIPDTIKLSLTLKKISYVEGINEFLISKSLTKYPSVIISQQSKAQIKR